MESKRIIPMAKCINLRNDDINNRYEYTNIKKLTVNLDTAVRVTKGISRHAFVRSIIVLGYRTYRQFHSYFVSVVDKFCLVLSTCKVAFFRKLHLHYIIY